MLLGMMLVRSLLVCYMRDAWGTSDQSAAAASLNPTTLELIRLPLVCALLPVDSASGHPWRVATSTTVILIFALLLWVDLLDRAYRLLRRLRLLRTPTDIVMIWKLAAKEGLAMLRQDGQSRLLRSSQIVARKSLSQHLCFCVSDQLYHSLFDLVDVSAFLDLTA